MANNGNAISLLFVSSPHTYMSSSSSTPLDGIWGEKESDRKRVVERERTRKEREKRVRRRDIAPMKPCPCVFVSVCMCVCVCVFMCGAVFPHSVTNAGVRDSCCS